jgi:hypothetical protein
MGAGYRSGAVTGHRMISFAFLFMCAFGQGEAGDGRSVVAAQGYSLQIPAGWRRISKSNVDASSPEIRAALNEIPIDKDCVEFLVSPSHASMSPAVVQMIVKPRPRPKDLGEWERAVKGNNVPNSFQIYDERDNRPMEIEKGEGHWRDIRGRREFVTERLGFRSGAKTPLRLWHVGWFAGRREVHLVALARTDLFNQYSQEIEGVIFSVRIEPWWKSWLTLPYLLLMVAILATIAVAIFWRRRRKRKK